MWKVLRLPPRVIPVKLLSSSVTFLTVFQLVAWFLAFSLDQGFPAFISLQKQFLLDLVISDQPLS